jgi:hypothetical protein
MESNLIALVCWSKEKTLEVLKENKIQFSVFPDLNGDAVLFFGFDQYLYAVIKRKFKGNAIVKEYPTFVSGLKLPVVDSLYQGSGVWIALPTARIKLPLPKIVVPKNLLFRLSLANAKKISSRLEN